MTLQVLQDLLIYLKKHTTLATSSSIDFPEEDGAPKGFDARAILSQALHLAHA
jgi:hypothetical protein